MYLPNVTPASKIRTYIHKLQMQTRSTAVQMGRLVGFNRTIGAEIMDRQMMKIKGYMHIYDILDVICLIIYKVNATVLGKTLTIIMRVRYLHIR